MEFCDDTMMIMSQQTKVEVVSSRHNAATNSVFIMAARTVHFRIEIQ